MTQITGVKKSAFDTVKAKVDAVKASTVLLSDYGILGDGSDEGAEWEAMRDALIAIDPARLWSFVGDPGKTYYGDLGRVFNGLHHIAIDFNGSEFRNTETSGNWYINLGENAFVRSNSTARPNYLISDASEGDTEVTFETASDAANFSAGDRIFLYGCQRQDGGYPPNYAFYEWPAVTDVNELAGTITLDRAIRNSYRTDWRDISKTVGIFGISTTITSGAARVINWTQENLAQSITIRNAKILHPDTAFSYNTVLGSCIDVLFEDCVLGWVYPAMFETWTMRRCRIEKIVLDKNGFYFTLDSSSISEDLSEGTGIENFVANSVTFESGAELNLYAPRRQTWTNSRYLGRGPSNAIIRANSNYSSGADLSLRDSLFQVLPDHGTKTFLSDYIYALTSISSVTGNEFVFSEQANIQDMGGRFNRGARFYADNGVVGEITYVKWDGSQYVHGFRATGAITASNGLWFPRYNSISFDGSRVENKTEGLSLTPPFTGSLDAGWRFDHRLKVSSTISSFDYGGFVGIPTKLEINVIRAYTGADVAPLFRVEHRFGTTNLVSKSVDVSITGSRVCRSDSGFKAEATDTGFTTPFATGVAQTVNRLRCYFPSGKPAGSDAEMPVIQVRATIAPNPFIL